MLNSITDIAEERQYFNHMLREELSNFFVNPDLFYELGLPLTVTEADVWKIDADKFFDVVPMSVFEVGEDILKWDGCKASMWYFLLAKFAQLSKKINARDYYDPDAIELAILYLIATQSNTPISTRLKLKSTALRVLKTWVSDQYFLIPPVESACTTLNNYMISYFFYDAADACSDASDILHYGLQNLLICKKRQDKAVLQDLFDSVGCYIRSVA